MAGGSGMAALDTGLAGTGGGYLHACKGLVGLRTQRSLCWQCRSSTHMPRLLTTQSCCGRTQVERAARGSRRSAQDARSARRSLLALNKAAAPCCSPFYAAKSALTPYSGRTAFKPVGRLQPHTTTQITRELGRTIPLIMYE